MGFVQVVIGLRDHGVRSLSSGASISINSLSQPFPSKFIFRNWFFPRKVSYFP